MLRNIASQKWRVYAWDATTGLPKTGDAANITAYLTKDDGTPAAISDTNPTEVSSTNEPGYYDFDVTQSESNAAKLSLSPKSSTSNVVVVACPPVVYTRPQYFSVLGVTSAGKAPATVAAGDIATDAIDAASLKADAVEKIQDGLSTFDHTTNKVTVATNEDKSGYGLADGAITSGKFGSGAITSTTFAAGALDAVWSASSRTLTSFGSLVADVASAVWAATTRTLSAFSFTVQLDSSQPDYAPAKAGDKMDLVDSPNGDAITAIQSGLSTFNPASDTVKLDATQSAYAPAKAGDAMTLTEAYDAAKNAASQSSVNAVKDVTDKLDEMIETDSNGDFLFTELALSNAPTGSGGGSGGDATEANQLVIIGHLEDIKGATFDTSTDSLEAIRNRGDSAWITATGFATPTNITNAVSAIESYGDANWATATGFATASDVTDAVDELKSYGDTKWVTATGFATADALQEAKAAIDAIPTSKEGYKLAADGLALVVPTDPGTDEPVFGTSSIVTWIGFFGAVSLNKATVNSDTGKATIRNSSDTADLVSYSISDDGTEFVMGPAE
jgi:hypothetical protein